MGNENKDNPNLDCKLPPDRLKFLKCSSQKLLACCGCGDDYGHWLPISRDGPYLLTGWARHYRRVKMAVWLLVSTHGLEVLGCTASHGLLQTIVLPLQIP